ncbi:DUF815 domain-containing protein [Helicobacter zhangjianzhongii]|uniref:DUF815 domain-containing protein n=1 Tax=Helicobacter zhangjianzhongii TaxID=2974574 RepID=UPI002552CCC8|nr:DUF815 domain-containing protein [Helicobacter sp. CPD2-1]MDL0079300.1 ATP-binding protein [Helicobacter sp. CPD2-1]
MILESTKSPFKVLENAEWHTYRAYIIRTFAGKFCLRAIMDFGEMPSLVGIESQARVLQENTSAFLAGKQALHALLFGARGCGKSSLIKATLLPYLLDSSSPLRVLELDSKDICLLPLVFDSLRDLPYRFIVFCDDIAFNQGDPSYKSLKSTLQGSLEARASNILLYATSNLRRLLESTSLRAGSSLPPSNELVQEELALSERFGLQIGFYDIGTQEYLAHIARLLDDETILQETSALRQSALNFAAKIGGRNARIAEEFAIAWRNKSL